MIPFFHNYIDEAECFMTSEMMSIIMCMPHSSKSFDFIVTKDGNGKLWFDLRDESELYDPQPFESVFKRLVKDASAENYLTSINKEALKVKLRFKEFVLDKKRDPILGPDGASSFSQQKGFSSTAYRYKKFDLTDYSVVCRCGFDAYDDNRNPVMVLCTTQHDPRETKNTIAWDEEIERKFGAVKSSDVQNNFFRYRRWATEAVLVKAKTLILGFCSRVHHEDSKEHQILKTMNLDTKEFAKSFCRLRNLENGWGVFNNLIQKFRQDDFEEGKYVVLRDAMRDRIHIFKVDDNEFDEVVVDEYGGFGASRI